LKICKVCGQEKPLTEFEKYKRTRDGHTSRCLDCGREYKKQKLIGKYGSVYAGAKRYRDGHLEQLKQRKHEYYENNKDAVLEQHHKYYEEHREEVGAMCKAYREANSEWKKAYDKQYALEHPEQISQYKKTYRDGHKEEARNYRKVRRHTDVWYKLRLALTRRVHKALGNTQKRGHTLDLIGCSIRELQVHLEGLFLEGMSWENYGYAGWHIDHVRPCASFDLTDPAQQNECFHYSNLQPLWAKDNMRKGAKWQGPCSRRIYSRRIVEEA